MLPRGSRKKPHPRWAPSPLVHSSQALRHRRFCSVYAGQKFPGFPRFEQVPQTREDDPERAVWAALAIRDALVGRL